MIKDISMRMYGAVETLWDYMEVTGQLLTLAAFL
jgi:hypothetical protein